LTRMAPSMMAVRAVSLLEKKPFSISRISSLVLFKSLRFFYGLFIEQVVKHLVNQTSI
jgi:hypothetical protein